jgi:multidrug efflux pump subunit AcrB
MDNEERLPFLTRVVDLFLRGDVAILLIVVSLILGGVSLVLTPREEEPQIVVPLADVFVAAPGLSAEEVEQQVTIRLEKLLYQIDGVEYVYSMSRPGQAIVTVRFYVGEDREDSLLKLYNKIHSNTDRVPPVVTDWVVKPVEIDDVPIVVVSLWSENPRYGDHELRRIAEQFNNELQSIPQTNRVHVVGGRPRRIRVLVDPTQLAARQTSLIDVANALKASNVNVRAGEFQQQDEEFVVEAGTFLTRGEELGDLVIAVSDGQPIYLRDVAQIIDGPAEPTGYSWIGFGPAEHGAHEAAGGAARDAVYPAVHLAIAKQKDANAVWVADAVHERMQELAGTHLPAGVKYRITRDYGETADEKVNELVESLVVAVLTVIGLIGLVLGWRAALVVALAIPVCYSLTLFVNLLAGYTINRVTMFALILALGLLVDDPITDVENIARYFSMRIMPARNSVLRAIQEVRPALILSTLAIIVSFLPLVFITGMMGPYMAPMALNVPLTVTFSTVVAFLVTPWLAMVALRSRKPESTDEQPGYDLTRQPLYRFASAALGPVLDRRGLAWAVLGGVAVLFVASLAAPAFRLVPLKMLPYDNKNEFQIVVDMPEGSTLERTDAAARELGRYLSSVSEVRDYQVFVGGASPMDFNGMVRHYFLRSGPTVADVRVNLAPKEQRAQQSHEILLRLRSDLEKLGESLGAQIKLVEVPPGPPVLATITAEVYGPDGGDYAAQIAAAEQVAARLEREPGVVDVDTSSEQDQVRWVFETDKPKAALSGVSTENIARTLQLALGGENVTVLHAPGEIDPLWVELRLPRSRRSAIDELRDIYVRGEDDEIVQIGALGEFVEQRNDKTIYHKNLKRVVFVYGEVAGRPPAEAIVDMQLDRTEAASAPPPPGGTRAAEDRTWFSPGGGDTWSVPTGYQVEWAGEGEWKITLDVFRDLGLAFAAAQVGIFVLLMFQTRSRLLPLVIMLAIPLSMIGIMPGFWLLNMIVNRPVGGFPNPVFMTATAMIGMIALSGIVVRNSVVLIDFIHHGQAEGLPLREAIVRSVAVRTRPILLTAGTTLLGNWVITLDPIFSGLAWAIIFGMLASTVFTLIVIPVVYWLLYGGETEHATASVER